MLHALRAHRVAKWVHALPRPTAARRVQVRVTQGKEPPHFVQLWGGRMVVYSGGVASGFRTVADDDAAPDDAAPRLFHVKASGSVPPYAVQVAAEAASLNSGARRGCSVSRSGCAVLEPWSRA